MNTELMQQRQRDLLHYFVGTLQPRQVDWKGRPVCLLFRTTVQFLCSASPREHSPGPHTKVQESKWRSTRPPGTLPELSIARCI